MRPATRPPNDERVEDASTWSYATWLAAAQREESFNRIAEATAAYQAALRLNPTGMEALSGLARISARMLDHEGAIEWSRRAAHLHQDDLESHLQLASHLQDARQLDEASNVLDALPGEDARTCAARGTCMILQGHMNEGMRWLRRAVELDAHSCEVRTALGIGFWRCHKRMAAQRELEIARSLDPQNMHARFVLQHLLLELGNFSAGYADTAAFDAIYPPALTGRRWQGQPIAGKRLLLYDQHGLGDTLQMVRYVEVCAKLGAQVHLMVRRAMLPLLCTLRGLTGISAMDEPLPEFDFQARLLDLVAIFRHAPASLPQRIPYLSAEPARVERMARELAGLPRPWIGVAWRGNLRQKDGLIRTCTVDDLRPLSKLQGSLVSLQRDASHEEIEALGAIDVAGLDGDGAFLDSAAVIRSLDMVLSIDTSVAHLAGALGARVLLLLPYWSDWRWMADRSDTPWYPRMRLFRQERPHDWSAAVAALVRALRSAEIERS